MGGCLARKRFDCGNKSCVMRCETRCVSDSYCVGAHCKHPDLLLTVPMFLCAQHVGELRWEKHGGAGSFSPAERRDLNALLRKARAVCTARENGLIRDSVQLYLNTCPQQGYVLESG